MQREVADVIGVDPEGLRDHGLALWDAVLRGDLTNDLVQARIEVSTEVELTLATLSRAGHQCKQRVVAIQSGG